MLVLTVVWCAAPAEAAKAGVGGCGGGEDAAAAAAAALGAALSAAAAAATAGVADPRDLDAWQEQSLQTEWQRKLVAANMCSAASLASAKPQHAG